MKTVLVTFKSKAPWGVNKEYEYYVPDDMDVKEGDELVVDSPSEGYTVVKVVSLKLQGKATKRIVCKVDDEEYKREIERDKQRKALLLELEKLDKKLKEESKYEYLRSISPEAAELINKLERI